MTVVGTIEYDVSINTAGLQNGQKAIENATAKAAASGEKNLKSIASSSDSSIKTLKSGWNNLSLFANSTFSKIGGTIKVGLVAGFTGGIAAMKNFIDAGSQLQSLRASFISLTGSAENAGKVMSTLYDFGKQTAFTNEQINQTARLFLGAGISADKLMSTMKQVGDVAGATGADLQGIALPLSQAFARGALMTQDWYQILNQGGGVLKDYIIQALGAGHSTQTFADDLSAGAVNTSVLNQALELATKNGGAAFNGAITQANTFNGRMSNMKEAINTVG